MPFGQAMLAVLFFGAGEDFKHVGKRAVAGAVPVFAGAAGAGAGQKRAVLANGIGALLRGVAERHGLLRGVLHHLEQDRIVEFVHPGEILGGAARGAALEHGNREWSARAEFLGHEEAGPSAAYDGYVDMREILHRLCVR